MSTPSMIKLPPSNSVSLSRVEMSDDFPAPVLPTMPTLSPPTEIYFWLRQGAQEVLMSVRLSVRVSGPNLSRAVNLHHSGSNLQAISQE